MQLNVYMEKKQRKQMVKHTLEASEMMYSTNLPLQ